MLRCRQCGYEWIPKIKEPTKCPGCYSRLWNRERINKPPINREPLAKETEELAKDLEEIQEETEEHTNRKEEKGGLDFE